MQLREPLLRLARREGLIMQTQLFINGQWRPGSNGETLPVTDPSDGSEIAQVALADDADAVEAIAAAETAGKAWAATAPRHRAEVLRRCFDLMTEKRQDIARLIVRENGKCLRDALSEADYAAEFFRWYSEEAVRNIGQVSHSPAGTHRIVVVQQPVGVSVLVTPWNFPAAMATRKIGPALAAGCSVILKPASETPLTALLVADLMQQAGVPDGVVNVLTAKHSGRMVATLLADLRVRKLSFTGSTQVGRILLAEAAKTVVNCSMELGGNAPFIVTHDADIDAAVAGAMVAKMRNGGEACTAANRFFVHESVADEFGQKFAAAMAALKTGPGLEDGVELGPLVSARARKDVAGLVDDAVACGANVLTGGSIPERPGYFYDATVLDQVPANARMLSEEIFGPVAPIVRFSDEADVIAQANDTEYGLVAYLYTRDLKRGLQLSEQLDAGMIGLNRGVVSDPAAPFGGTKQSGVGREGSDDGMLAFLEKKYISTEW